MCDNAWYWLSWTEVRQGLSHDDVIKWKHFPRYWPFVRGIHWSPVNSPHKGQWRGALMFSLICALINGWVNNREAGDLRRHRAHYDVIVMHPTTLRAQTLSCTYRLTGPFMCNTLTHVHLVKQNGVQYCFYHRRWFPKGKHHLQLYTITAIRTEMRLCTDLRAFTWWCIVHYYWYICGSLFDHYTETIKMKK